MVVATVIATGTGNPMVGKLFVLINLLFLAGSAYQLYMGRDIIIWGILLMISVASLIGDFTMYKKGGWENVSL